MNIIADYINNLALDESSHLDSFPDYEAFETDTSNPSFLNFKGLNSFSKDVSKQRQEDVLNSLLLAQRAATKAYPASDQIYEWYKMYFEVLQKIGWLVVQQDFNSFDSKSSSVELDKAIMSLLQDLLTNQQLQALMKSFELIKSLGKSDERVIAFERNSHYHNKGNFQMGLAEEVNGNVSILSSGFILESEKKITNILFLSLDKNKINLKFSFFRADLVASQYDENRELIKAKLGDASQYIASLDI